MQWQLVSAFVLYISVVFIIGIVSSLYYKNKQELGNSGDFILGGRSTHWLLTALSAHAADMSDWLFMGLPAAVYVAGGVEAWIPIGLVIGMFLAWHYIASPLRIASEKYHAYTIASYFQKRYQDNSGILGGLTALISFFFFAAYIAVSLKGIGYVLYSAFGMNYHIGILIALAVILSYLLIGGFASVALLDLFQGTFLLCMLLLVPLYGLMHVGGITSIQTFAAFKGISLSLFPSWSLSSFMYIILNPFAWCLGYFGMPHILTKFMGSADAENMHKAKYVGLTWQLLATGAALAVGFVGIAYFAGGIPMKNELIFVEMAKSLFSPFVAGIVLCAILAATISTVDSQLLVLAGIIAEDFYKGLINKQATVVQVYRVYMFALVGSACVGFCVAWDEASTIMGLVRYAWAGLGASYGPLMLCSLYSHYPNKYGAMAGMIVGGVIAATWSLINPYVTYMPVYAIVPGFIASFCTIYFITWCTKTVR